MVYLAYSFAALFGLFAVLWVGWSFFLASMTLKRARGTNKLSKSAGFFGAPVTWMALCMNVFINTIILTVILLDWPREKYVSKRMNRLIRTDDGWRGKLALWFRSDMLDYLDPDGPHR